MSAQMLEHWMTAPDNSSAHFIGPVPQAAGESLRILAVDDQPALTKLVAAMLTPLGHVVMTASSAEAALDHLREASYHLVISDIGLGNGMDGWELAALLRRQVPPVPVVLVTGWSDEADAQRAVKEGITALITKPFRRAQLLSIVSTM
jgi:CheY-like chemotaxis protein